MYYNFMPGFGTLESRQAAAGRLSLTSTAVHEAAHVAAALNTGHRRPVWAQLDGPMSGAVTLEPPQAVDPLSFVFGLVAGHEAEVRFLSMAVHLDGEPGHNGADDAAVRGLLDTLDLGDDVLSEVKAEAALWLGRPGVWKQVEAVADALMEHRQLDGKALFRLVAGAAPLKDTRWKPPANLVRAFSEGMGLPARQVSVVAYAPQRWPGAARPRLTAGDGRRRGEQLYREVYARELGRLPGPLQWGDA